MQTALGWPPIPVQTYINDVAHELLPSGEWAYPIVVITLQRQAGKTALVAGSSTHRCLSGPDRDCWYTAQHRSDARDNFMKLAKKIRRSPFAPPFAKIRESNGSESISFPTGSAYGLFAPSEEALHGKANAKVDIDEVWTFTQLEGDALLQAIMPTFATVDGQLWLYSAAGTAESTWLRGLVDAGRLAAESGATSGMAYFECSIPDDVDPADLAAVAAHHPATGYTLRPRALADAARIMRPGEFARAYGNRWPDGAVESVIPALVWQLAADGSTPLPDPGRAALAFDVGMGGADAAIVAGWRDDAGVAHVELVDVRDGTSWLPGRLADLVELLDPVAVTYDRMGPAVAVGDEIIRAGLDPTPVTFDDLAGAASAFLAGLAERRTVYRPHPALDAAVAAAVRREVGDRWVWGRRGAGSVAALIAATLTVWAFDHARPPEDFHVR